MIEIDLELTDDDDVFEPTAWDFAVTIGIRADPETDREALDELADAMLAGAPEATLETLTDQALPLIWNQELEQLVRNGVTRLLEEDDWHVGAAATLEAFDRSPAEAEVSREVVRHLAMELGHADQPVFFCLSCIDESLEHATDRRSLALRTTVLARRDAAVPDAEIRAALARLPSSPAMLLATDERRAAVRARLGRLGRFGRQSLPALSAELLAIAEEPLPSRSADDVWAEVCTYLLADAARPDLN